jgi:hypothetical protein
MRKFDTEKQTKISPLLRGAYTNTKVEVEIRWNAHRANEWQRTGAVLVNNGDEKIPQILKENLR